MTAPRQKIAIVGASSDRSKFGNKAVRAFVAQGWEVFPINPTLDSIEGVPAYRDLASIPGDHLDRVSFYVPPQVGIRILDQIRDKQVDEVWINPGAESPELLKRAEELGIETIQACSILDVGEDPHSL
ncbi:CoA-binding protein [Planctomyces sp. SH-PL62]|uniref:CoA-binding protein n=1 Tax=Planctomyces sp. SH-PL62 TaxID=1636152 RepID=UPI00078E80F2|nr:CoA-binding protein [Planctomyces sp. SH-PL62]AMV36207.1 hypothetical protein VT85_02105 [Planctomyces sp. SH-PL62]